MKIRTRPKFRNCPYQQRFRLRRLIADLPGRRIAPNCLTHRLPAMNLTHCCPMNRLPTMKLIRCYSTSRLPTVSWTRCYPMNHFPTVSWTRCCHSTNSMTGCPSYCRPSQLLLRSRRLLFWLGASSIIPVHSGRTHCDRPISHYIADTGIFSFGQ
jgi:hypothetical protein